MPRVNRALLETRVAACDHEALERPIPMALLLLRRYGLERPDFARAAIYNLKRERPRPAYNSH